MKKQSYLAAAALLAVVALIGAGCSDTGSNRPMIASSERQIEIEKDQINETAEASAEDSVQESDASVEEMTDVATDSSAEQEATTEYLTDIGNRNFYVAEKVGSTTTVSVENTQSGDRDALFTFEESWEYQPTSGNHYEMLSGAVDYSPARNEFVYITNDEIYTYDVATGTTSPLVTKTGDSTGEIDGLEMPVWSVDGLQQGALGLFAVEYAPDGSKLRVSLNFYEGLAHSVIDLNTMKVTQMNGGNFDAFDWSDESDDALVAVQLGAMASPGLFVATDNAYDEAINVYQHEGTGMSVESAVWLEDGTILITFQDTSIYDEDPTAFLVDDAPYYLAHVNADGTMIEQIQEFNGYPKLHIGEGMKGYFTYSRNGYTHHGVVDATDYSVQNIVGGDGHTLQSVTNGILVQGANYPRGESFHQSLAMYSERGELLFSTRYSSEGALTFLDWAQ